MLKHTLILAIASISMTAQVMANLDVQLSVTEQTINLGELLTVSFLATNRGVTPSLLDLGFNREEAFRITVTAPDGHSTEVQRPLPHHSEILVRLGRFEIPAGESYNQRLRISESYRVTQVGTYIVKIDFVPPFLNGAHGREFRILVTEHDADRLRSVCERLTRVALSPAPDSEAVDASIDLSLISDPVAIPYLEKVLKGLPAIRPAAVIGLGRIGTVEAAAVLLGVLKSPDDEQRQRALGALTMLARTTRDPSLSNRLAAAGISK